MTYINDIPEGEHRERLRAEIFRNLRHRREEALGAFDGLCKYMGIVLSGGAIAVLSFIGARKDHIPMWSFLSFFCFAISILSFVFFLHRHYQLTQSRWNLYADAADKFFHRELSFEQLSSHHELLRSKWLYRFLFYIPTRT
jgi:hypothetical protein